MAALAIARLELLRLFSTKRGWIATIAFLLVWMLIIRYIIYPAADWLSSPDTGPLADLFLGSIGLEGISRWPSAELALYWVLSLYLLPFFCIMIAADQIASDKARGTLRYITLRASRSNVFFGRFMGQAFIQFLLIAATLVSVVALVAVRSPDRLSGVLETIPMVIANLFIVLLPYIALMALVSVLAKTARQATLFAVIGWILVSLVVAWVQSQYGPYALLDWVLPGSQISTLIKMSGWQTLELAVVPLLHTVVLLVLGWWAMQRCDL